MVREAERGVSLLECNGLRAQQLRSAQLAWVCELIGNLGGSTPNTDHSSQLARSQRAKPHTSWTTWRRLDQRFCTSYRQQRCAIRVDI
jgi:hypothetical protein